jgi:hypothetical protein
MSTRQNSFDVGTTGAGKSECDMESSKRFITAKIRCTEVQLCLVRNVLVGLKQTEHLTNQSSGQLHTECWDTFWEELQVSSER